MLIEDVFGEDGDSLSVRLGLEPVGPLFENRRTVDLLTNIRDLADLLEVVDLSPSTTRPAESCPRYSCRASPATWSYDQRSDGAATAIDPHVPFRFFKV